jgi:putative hydrolase of HD superfamily
MKIALVHDMAESIVGDIAPMDKVSKEEKHRREKVTCSSHGIDR